MNSISFVSFFIELEVSKVPFNLFFKLIFELFFVLKFDLENELFKLINFFIGLISFLQYRITFF